MAQISIIIRHPMVIHIVKPGIWDRLLFVLHYTWDPFFVDQLLASHYKSFIVNISSTTRSSIIFVNQLISSGRKVFEVVNQMVRKLNIVFEIIVVEK